MNNGPTGITVAWAFENPSTGWVEYGETPELGLRADGNDAGLRPYAREMLRVVISGLQAGREYYYRTVTCAVEFVSAYAIARGPTISGEIRSFRTLDPAGATASMTVWNDTHQHVETLTQLVAALYMEPTNLLIWNGDIFDAVNDESQIVWSLLSPGGLALPSSSAVFFSRGNHDVRGSAARKLSLFLRGPSGNHYYAFRDGPLACVVMDTGEDKSDDAPVYAGLNDFAHYREIQARWLAEAILDPVFISAPFRILFTHIPLVWEAEVPEAWHDTWGHENKGWICEDGRAKWHDLLVKAKVDVVVSGHTHRPAWFPPNAERPYAQLIGGGPTPETAASIRVRADETRLLLEVRSLGAETIIAQEVARRDELQS